jgi:hypothetical protein
MKKAFITALTFFCATSFAFSQDIVATKSKGEIKVKVIEVSPTEVKYKKIDTLVSQTFIISTSDVISIQYENGVKDIFNDNAQKGSNDRYGTVYFIRSTGYQGSAVAFTAFIDRQLVCKLNNKKYSVHKVVPGERSFSVQFAGKNAKENVEEIRINIEEGKTYFIQMILQTGLLINNLYCQEVTQNSAKLVLVNCVEDTKCF